MILFGGKTMKSNEQLGSLYAILSGFLYGFIGYFGLSAMNGSLAASTMLFWRFLISSLIIAVILLPRLKTRNDSLKSMSKAFVTGMVYYSLSTLLYFYSAEYIGSGLAMVIFFTYPVMIMLLNYFFYGQSITPVYYVAIAIILIGMLFMMDMSKVAFDLIGIILGLVSAFFYASYIVASKNNKISPNLSTLMVCLGCMTTCFFVSFFSHSLAVPSSSTVWFNLFGISIVATVIPILLMLYSLNYISSEKASILSVLEPVFVVILGVFLLGEQVKPSGILGIIFVLSGALMTLFSHKWSQYHFFKRVGLPS